MPEGFDPYYKWLGIAADEQPANYYRLLGIRLFESDPDVIAGAADQRMMHVRSFQSGRYSELSQQILNELAAARVCLLSLERKAAYDKQLREEVASKRARTTPLPVPGPVQPGRELPGLAVAVTPVSSMARRRRPDWQVPVAVVGTTVAFAVCFFGLFAAGSGRRQDVAKRADREATVNQSVGGYEQVARDERHSHFDQRPEDAPAHATPAHVAPADDALAQHPEAPELPDAQPVPRPPPPSVAWSDVGQTDAANITDLPKPTGTTRHSATVGSPEKQRDRDERKPVPESSEQQRVHRTIEDVFEEPQDRDEILELANKLAALTAESADATERFVLLRRASELAAGAGDARRSLQLVDRIADEFDIDRLQAQATMLDTVAKQVSGKEQIGALVDASATVVDEALTTERFDLADALSASVYHACISSAGQPFRVQALARRREVQRLRDQWNKVEAARAALESNPVDEAAHTVLGRWYCFLRDDWERGVPHLAQGGEPELRQLADRELDTPADDPTIQLELADAWWDQAEKEQAEAQQRIQQRAVLGYQKALRDLRGLSRERAERRIASLAPEPEPEDAAIKSTPTPKPAVRPEPFVAEGVGIGNVVLGATEKEIVEALGLPERREDLPNVRLVYRKNRGIDILFAGGMAREIRFNPGFPLPLRRGPSIGSSLQEVVAAYGKPAKVVKAERAGFEDRVLYQLPRSSKIVYQNEGVLFWFDNNGRVFQFVVVSR